MTDPHLFWIILSAVLGGNILTGMFFWGAITYTRMEREGRQHTAVGNGVFVSVLMPLLFLGGAFYLAMGGS